MKQTLLTLCLILFALPCWSETTFSSGIISSGEDSNIESKPTILNKKRQLPEALGYQASEKHLNIII